MCNVLFFPARAGVIPDYQGDEIDYIAEEAIEYEVDYIAGGGDEY